MVRVITAAKKKDLASPPQRREPSALDATRTGGLRHPVQGARDAPGDGGGGHSGGNHKSGTSASDDARVAPLEAEIDGARVTLRALDVQYVGVPLCVAMAVPPSSGGRGEGPRELRVRVTRPGVYIMLSHLMWTSRHEPTMGRQGDVRRS